MKNLVIILVTLFFLLIGTASTTLPQDGPVWPGPPDEYRIKYLDEIRCDQLVPEGGFFKKMFRWIGGKAESDKLSLPFDLVIKGNSIFMVCQNLSALVEMDRATKTFKLYNCKKLPFIQPISLCRDSQGSIFITDTKTNAVYRLVGDKIELVTDSGLVRPTGITALADSKRLYVVDTGDQNVKVLDYEGHLIGVFGKTDNSTLSFNYPTFAARINNDAILINDALNYQIKKFDLQGNLVNVFGQEGDGPGTFARPKGLATDSDGHIYVVDNLYDNVQIFNDSGQVLLVVGSTGQQAGQFWSPAGIDIVNDTIYIADTFNNRVQILYYRSVTL